MSAFFVSGFAGVVRGVIRGIEGIPYDKEKTAAGS
jgi:hypothetical protein